MKITTNLTATLRASRSYRLLFATCILLLFFTFQLSAQWSSIASFPAGPTDGSWSFTIGNKAYVGSGIAQGMMYVFDGTISTWSGQKRLPDAKPRAWAFAFAYNGKGYIGGGDTTAGFTVTDEFYEYNPETDTWKELAPFGGGARDGCFAFVVGDKAYVGGGFDGQFINSDVWEYDFASNTWSTIGFYPGGPVIFPSTFVVNGEPYVVGGAGETELQSMFTFDPQTHMWTEKRPFPGTARQAGAAFAIGGKGYYGGGMASYSTTFTDFWSYDVQLDKWEQVAIYPRSTTAWPVAFVVGEQAYFGTGAAFTEQGLAVSSQFYSFTPGSSSVREQGERIDRGEMWFNRATNSLHVVLADRLNSGKANFILRDLRGGVVEQGNVELSNGDGEAQVGMLSSGIYFYSLTLDGKETTGKLLLQR